MPTLVGGPMDGKVYSDLDLKVFYLECNGQHSYEGSAIYLTPPSMGGVKYILNCDHYIYAGVSEPTIPIVRNPGTQHEKIVYPSGWRKDEQ